MSDIAITVENISKQYRIGVQKERYATFRESLVRALRAPFNRLRRLSGQAGPQKEMIWALKDVSMEVKHGEVLGIIGPNGSGKSTLLKILCRVTRPTKGRTVAYGRVGSLLEVGTGFHPELTGRENIFLNGAVMGMTKAEIRGKFDEIVDFSGAEKFLDTPVKRYSSGMQVRLAFSVAAHLEPEILLIDEVLAVGDVGFQRKCLGKMQEVSRQGRTVLVVSHVMSLISLLASRCLLLSEGKNISLGPTGDVLMQYMDGVHCSAPEYKTNASGDVPRIASARVITSHLPNIQVHGKPLKVVFEIMSPRPLGGAALAFQVLNERCQPVLNIWSFDSERAMCRERGVYVLVARIPKVRLYLGKYSLRVHFAEKGTDTKLETLDGICPFEVVMETAREYPWIPEEAIYLEDVEWSVSKK